MFTVIVTIGPSLLDQTKLNTINELGNCIFRINGAHADRLMAKNIITKVRLFLPHAKIMIDLPGNKVRTANLSEAIRLKKGECFSLDQANINFPDFYKYVKKGDHIYANDSIFHFVVEEVEGTSIIFNSHSDGLLLTNKGLHLQGVNQNFPFLFQRDQDLIQLAIEENIDYLSLSFVRSVKDVLEAKDILEQHPHVGKKPKIVTKVETMSAVENLDEILKVTEMINVDRGDLSTDVGMMQLSKFQSLIVSKGLAAGKKVFLATQFLKSMEENPLPFIAELMDLHNTIKSGVTGIQLSEETAVGKYPYECVKLIFDSVQVLLGT